MATDKGKIMQLAQCNASCPPQGFNGVGEAQEPNCKDMMHIYLVVNPSSFVVDSGFTLSEGACATVCAAARVAAELAQNKPALVAYSITAKDIAKQLSDDGTMDREHLHCAIMAELALKRAVVNYSAGRQSV